MSRLDLIIFGATGFTGKYAVIETVRLCKKYPDLKWGVAGRSEKKLDELIQEVSKKTGEDLSEIRRFIADVKDESSLKYMCENAKVLVNCCGPYRFYGEAVVRAAIEAKTNYVDVSGEPQFMESMQLHYDDLAREAGVYVVSACGFDSIPNDLGVIYLQKNFKGTLNSVESYLSVSVSPEYEAAARSSGVIHYGTWESLVYGLAYKGELPELRKKLFPDRLPSLKPRLQKQPLLHRRAGGWCLPFPGADGSVVFRSQRRLHRDCNLRPVQFKPYVKFPSLVQAILTLVACVILFIMSMTSVTRNLLLKFPRLFSAGMVTRDGPSEAVMNNTKFQFKLFGQGWEEGADVDTAQPEKKMIVTVSGVNPGYGATVDALLLSAITVLQEKDKMPGTGGVMTTGFAFKDTELVKKLNENNLTFEVVQQEN